MTDSGVNSSWIGSAAPGFVSHLPWITFGSFVGRFDATCGTGFPFGTAAGA